MKKNFQLNKIIDKAISNSFENDKLVESTLVKNIKAFKILPVSQSIYALSEYLKGIKRKLRNHTLVVETSIPLSATQIKKIKDKMSQKFNIVRIEEKVNPELLGGVRLQIGDNIFDSSVSSKVEQIKDAIKKNG